MNHVSAAEHLLKELGITDPIDIDLEAIAWHVGARIKYRNLDGCEARILGVGDQAIISVDQSRSSQRQRFSIGHELGHWEHHRGQALICRSEDIGAQARRMSSLESVANKYAANLLLPWYLFVPVLHSYSVLNLKTINEICTVFETSRSATAIRIVQSNEFPTILVCHDQKGRRWFKRSKYVPERWFPKRELDSDSFAFDLVFGDAEEKTAPSLMPAECWFERVEARKYDLKELCFRVGHGEVLIILQVIDDEMLSE